MNNNTTVERHEFMLKIVDLSIGCLANVAYYRSGRQNGHKLFRGEPYSQFNANCFFLVHLEWCKLFGNENQEKHHWCKLVSDKEKFKTGLLCVLDYDDDTYTKFQNKILKVRNKLVAHQDKYEKIYSANFDQVITSVSYLINYIYANEMDGIPIKDRYNPAEAYEKYYRWGETFWNGSTPEDDPENKLKLRTVKI